MPDSPYEVMLSVLDNSPMWGWGSNPMIFAVLSKDPVVMLPAFVVSDVATLRAFAQHWRTNMTNAEVPVSALCLVIEGLIGEGDEQQDVREAVVAEQDGTLLLFRHVRDDGIVEIDVGFDDVNPHVSAMREVAASAWR